MAGEVVYPAGWDVADSTAPGSGNAYGVRVVTRVLAVGDSPFLIAPSAGATLASFEVTARVGTTVTVTPVVGDPVVLAVNGSVSGDAGSGHSIVDPPTITLAGADEAVVVMTERVAL